MGDLTNPTLQPFAIPAHQDRIVPSYLGDVFLLNPANRQFVEGKTQQVAAQSARTGCILLFLILFLLVGAAVIVWAGSNLYEWNALNRTSVITLAEISDKRIASDEDSEAYYLSYRYSNTDTTYTHEQSVSSNVYNRAEIGAKLDIIYVRDNPNIAALAGSNNPPWFELGFGICWNLLVWAVFIAVLTGAWRNHILEKQGHVISGQVVTSAGSIDGDGDFTLKLDYLFCSPTTNKIIQGSTSQTQNDLKGDALPAQGAPLAILYRKDNHHKPL